LLDFVPKFPWKRFTHIPSLRDADLNSVSRYWSGNVIGNGSVAQPERLERRQRNFATLT
jgi:hypothetical protein